VKTKKPRGFALLTPERRREIAIMGGRATAREDRGFYRNRELAASAGSKGGKSRQRDLK